LSVLADPPISGDGGGKVPHTSRTPLAEARKPDED